VIEREGERERERERDRAREREREIHVKWIATIKPSSSLATDKNIRFSQHNYVDILFKYLPALFFFVFLELVLRLHFLQFLKPLKNLLLVLLVPA